MTFSNSQEWWSGDKRTGFVVETNVSLEIKITSLFLYFHLLLPYVSNNNEQKNYDIQNRTVEALKVEAGN